MWTGVTTKTCMDYKYCRVFSRSDNVLLTTHGSNQLIGATHTCTSEGNKEACYGCMSHCNSIYIYDGYVVSAIQNTLSHTTTLGFFQPYWCYFLFTLPFIFILVLCVCVCVLLLLKALLRTTSWSCSADGVVAMGLRRIDCTTTSARSEHVQHVHCTATQQHILACNSFYFLFNF
jgi:hypothetical protein